MKILFRAGGMVGSSDREYYRMAPAMDWNFCVPDGPRIGRSSSV